MIAATARRTAALLAAGVALLGVPAAATAATLQPEGHCLTPQAADGNEPPCNPALAPSEWPTSHRAGHESGSSPFPAPRPGGAVERIHTTLPNLVSATFPTFSGPDRNGLRVAWMNGNGPFSVTKTTLGGAVIDTWTEPTDEGAPPTVPTDQTATNVYNAVDRDGNYLLGSGTGIATFGNSVPGDNASPIRLLKRFALPAKAQCRGPDPVVGLSVLPDGMVALATKNGVVAVVPRQPAKQTADNVRAVRLDPRCDDPSVPTSALEENSNSIASDEQGGIYVVTNRAQYRVDWDGEKLTKRWDVEYRRGREAGAYTSSNRTPGSGQSPDVVSAGPGSERFIVIGDGQPLLHLLYLYADEVPKDAKPVRPGADTRIACEVPVDFGRPDATKTSSEQSILTRGYSSIVSDNTVPNEEVIKLLPALSRTLLNLFLGPEGTVAKGLERIDWDPETRTCKTVWSNPEASIPNAVPSMSSATGLIYGIANRGGIWGLQGTSFATGKDALWVPASAEVTENSFFAMTTVGPGDSIWTGTPFGLTIYRSVDPAAPPPLACRDVTPPTVRGLRARVGRDGRRLRLSGRASDTACGEDATLAGPVEVRARGGRVLRGRVTVTAAGVLRGSVALPKALRARPRPVTVVVTDRGKNPTTARAKLLRRARR